MTSTLDGGELSTSRLGRLYPGKGPVPILQGGWTPGPVWIGEENLAPTGIRSPDLLASSESLYRLSYPGPLLCIVAVLNCILAVVRVVFDDFFGSRFNCCLLETGCPSPNIFIVLGKIKKQSLSRPGQSPRVPGS
jgi:hypothetical protein